MAYDAEEAVDRIRESAGNDIDIIFGVAINDKIGEAIIVTVIATGFDLPKPELIPSDGPAASARPVSTGVQVQDDDSPAFGGGVVVEENDDDDSIPNFFSRN